MKRLFILLLSLTIALSFIGCGVKQKIEDKVGEAIGEKLIEDIGDGKVDISGDKVTIKGEDGAEVTFGGTEWPKSDLIKNISEFKNGTITSVMDVENYILVVVEKVKEEDFTEYLNDIKKTYTKNSSEMNSDGVISYGADNGNGFYVLLCYGVDNETLSINVTQLEK